MFKAPRRPAVRPYSQPIERDDDAVVDAGETAFVTGLVRQQRSGWAATPARNKKKSVSKGGYPSPVPHEVEVMMLEEKKMLREMSDADFEAWLVKEGVADCYIGDVYREDRK